MKTAKDIVCRICGEHLVCRNSMVRHAKKHFGDKVEAERLVVDSIYGHECVENAIEDYVSEKYCIASMPIDITKLLSLLGKKRTSSEERKTKRYKEKIESTIRDKYGDGITNVSQVESVKRKKEVSLVKTYGSLENYHNHRVMCLKDGYSEFVKDSERVRERTERTKTTLVRKYGVDNPSMIESVRKSISTKAKERHEGKTPEELSEMTSAARNAIPHHWKVQTRIEKIVSDAIKSLGYAIDTHRRFGRFSVDIVLPNEKIAIEVNGDVFHANPLLYSSKDVVIGKRTAEDIWGRDNRKRIAVEKSGFKFVTLWECDIRKNRLSICDFVRRSVFGNAA